MISKSELKEVVTIIVTSAIKEKFLLYLTEMCKMSPHSFTTLEPIVQQSLIVTFFAERYNLQIHVVSDKYFVTHIHYAMTKVTEVQSTKPYVEAIELCLRIINLPF